MSKASFGQFAFTCTQNNGPQHCLKFNIKKKLFNAVKRNLIKRRIKAIIHQAPLKATYDIHIHVKQAFDLSDKSVLRSATSAFLNSIT